MPDVFPFTTPDVSSFVPILGTIVIGGFLLILILFSIQIVQQVRLLNIFLQTKMAKAWLGLSIALLVITLLTGAWFWFA